MLKHTPEQVRFIADSIMPKFIPKDITILVLSFAFTADGANYEVNYLKNSLTNWQFVSYKNA